MTGFEQLPLGERPAGRWSLTADWVVVDTPAGRRLAPQGEVVIENDRVIHAGGRFEGEVAARHHMGAALIAPGFVDLDALADLDTTLLAFDNHPGERKGRVWPRSYVGRGPYEMYTPEDLVFQKRFAFGQLLLNGITSAAPIASLFYREWGETVAEDDVGDDDRAGIDEGVAWDAVLVFELHDRVERIARGLAPDPRPDAGADPLEGQRQREDLDDALHREGLVRVARHHRRTADRDHGDAEAVEVRLGEFGDVIRDLAALGFAGHAVGDVVENRLEIGFVTAPGHAYFLITKPKRRTSALRVRLARAGHWAGRVSVANSDVRRSDNPDARCSGSRDACHSAKRSLSWRHMKPRPSG